MVKIEDVTIGLRLRMIQTPHVKGHVCGLKPLGQKNWFKIQLDSGSLQLVQKPELWEIC